MSARVLVMRHRAAIGYGPGWLVSADTASAYVGSFAAAIHFATRLTTQPRKEQAMTTSPVIHPQVGVLDIQRTIALAEHALKIDPALLTATEDAATIGRVRDAANDAWLER